ncbi:MAG: signal recognition particle-docking protein FtsY [Thermodesulfobacteriota bacterium]
MQQRMYDIWETAITLAGQLPQEAFWGAGFCLAVFCLWVMFIRARRRRISGEGAVAAPPGTMPGAEELDEPETVGDPGGAVQPMPQRAGEPVHRTEPGETAAGAVSKTVAAAKPLDAEGFLGRLKSGLSKTRNTISGGLDRIFSGNRGLDGSALEDMEELLITADVGVQATMSLIQKVSARASEIDDIGKLKSIVKEELLAALHTCDRGDEKPLAPRPKIIMVVGVNGVGKTTTIGKLAARMAGEGKRVLIVAADTFRAAAIEQLSIWAERAGAEIVKHRQNADPAAVVYDGIEAALARDVDIVLVDTAGRLHTKVNLMEELKKIKRTIARKIPDAPHEVLMVLDATTGQNALVQAKMFHEALNVTGIVLTKLDGTAKGGIVVAICSALNISLDYIGVGEQAEDLQEFNARQFVDALL